MTDLHHWGNYPTWNVFSWLGGTQAEYETVCGLVLATATDEDAADTLREYMEDRLPDLPASLYRDLLTWACAQVNYVELAQKIRASADDYLAHRS